MSLSTVSALPASGFHILSPGCLPFSFLCLVFTFVFFAGLVVSSSFSSLFPLEWHSDVCQRWYLGFLLWKTSLRWMIALWWGSYQHCWVDPGRFLMHLGTSSSYQHPGIVTLAVGQRCGICLVSGCKLLVLDSMDFRFFLLLNSANKNFCTQEGNKPFILHGNCMCSAFYQ